MTSTLVLGTSAQDMNQNFHELILMKLYTYAMINAIHMLG